MRSDLSIGVDFGTTNTVVALARPGEPARAVVFRGDRETSDLYRSVLLFEKGLSAAGLDLDVSAGLAAIRAYLTSAAEIRFIQSFKSHVASPIFEETRVFGRRFKFEDLLAIFFRRALADADAALDPAAARVVAGRPVAFVGAAPDEALAAQRYGEAYHRIGVAAPAYVYEPVGAAFYYAQRLKTDALVLVADFGGGTSDFSLIRFTRQGDAVTATPLGHAGVAVAGDSFDYRIIDAVVSPHLGKGTLFRSMGKLLSVPQYYFASFARWHQLAMLKTPEHIRELEALARSSLSPEKIGRLLDVIRNDWGFNIYGAVSAVKAALSAAPHAAFTLRLGDLVIEQQIARADFEAWIAGDVARIAGAVDGLLAAEGIAPEAVDSVFLTGGSSFIPAVRRVFADRFGPARLAGGENFQSVAFGLALIGLEDDLGPWLANPAPAVRSAATRQGASP
ncbi:MAG TPA: Hsp70 family protein [Stellaceae bacterium]|nr:Hsp70 family protein [Stellaceae bacterium]